MRGRSIYAEQFDFVEYYSNLKLLDFTTSEAASLAIELTQHPEGPKRYDRLKQVRNRYAEKMVDVRSSSSSKLTSTRDPDAGADDEWPSCHSRTFQAKSPPKLGGKAQSLDADHLLPSRRSHAYKAKSPQKLRNTKLDATRDKAQSSSAMTELKSPANGMISKAEKAMYKCVANRQAPLPVGKNAGSCMDKHGGKRRAACEAGDDSKRRHWKKGGTEFRLSVNKRARGMQCENVKEEPHDAKDGEYVINSDDNGLTKRWISVPLQAATGEGISPGSDGDGEDAKFVQCSVKLGTERIAFAFGSVTKVMQEGMNFLENFNSDVNDAAFEEVRKFYTNAKGMVDKVERVIHTIQERQIEKLHAERVKLEEANAAEYRKILKEMKYLSKEILALKATHLHAEKKRENIEKDLTSELEKAREDLRLEKQKEHDKATDALKSQLEMEHDKDCCQICFAASRDALILPCLHLHYCNDCLEKHQRQNGECPTCRAKINGILRCHISIA